MTFSKFAVAASRLFILLGIFFRGLSTPGYRSHRIRGYHDNDRLDNRLATFVLGVEELKEEINSHIYRTTCSRTAERCYVIAPDEVRGETGGERRVAERRHGVHERLEVTRSTALPWNDLRVGSAF